MQDPLHYRGRRVVVTGCCSGIGRATAALLVELGAEVHGLDLQTTGAPMRSCTPVDLRDPVGIDAAVAALGGRVDGLFNCAGVPPGPAAMDVMKVNYIGTRHLTDRVVPLMPPGSAIVNVASNGGADWATHLPALRELVAAAGFAAAVAWFEANAATIANAYSYSKQALIVWTLGEAATLVRRGIRMNCTSPGAVQTPMLEQIETMVTAAAIDVMAQPIGRRSTAAEQAGPLVFLNSPAASYVNGVVLPVDGGFLGARVIAATPAEPVGRR